MKKAKLRMRSIPCIPPKKGKIPPRGKYVPCVRDLSRLQRGECRAIRNGGISAPSLYTSLIGTAKKMKVNNLDFSVRGKDVCVEVI